MDRNERDEYETRRKTHRETERILAKRDREKYWKRLNELEREEASTWSKIFWTLFSLLIAQPAGLVIYGFIAWSQIKNAFASHPGQFEAIFLQIWTQTKIVVIIFLIYFLLNILALLWWFWKISSIKKEMAQAKSELYNLEKDLNREF